MDMTLYQALSELPLAANAAGNRMDTFKVNRTGQPIAKLMP